MEKSNTEKRGNKDHYPRCRQERRRYNYTAYIPERRSGKDRRKNAPELAA